MARDMGRGRRVAHDGYPYQGAEVKPSLRATLEELGHVLGPHYVVVSFTCDKCGHEQHNCRPATMTGPAECIVCVLPPEPS